MTCRTAATPSFQHDVSILLYVSASLDHLLLGGYHRVGDTYVLTSNKEYVDDDSDIVSSRRHHQAVCGRGN